MPTSISCNTVLKAVEILGTDGITEEEAEEKISSMVANEVDFCRLRYCIPEAFGIILVSHLSDKIVLPKSFSVTNQFKEWVSIPIKDEPVFVEAIKIAQHIFHNGPRSCFKNISEMSSITNAINKTLNAGSSVEDMAGSTISTQINGIPAEIYLSAS